MNARHVVIALVALLLGLQGGAALAYTDAQILGLELSGQLLAPPEMVTQIAADLLPIRRYDVDGYFWNIHVRPSWLPGQIVILLTPDAWELYQAGDYHGLDALNAQYGPVQVVDESDLIDMIVLLFSQPYNPEILSPIYATAEGVRSASPDYTIGDGDDITATALGAYTFQHGWGDCLAGCFFYHYWDFTVTSGTVQLVSERGAEFGACCLARGYCVPAIRMECEEPPWTGLGGTFHGGHCVPSPCGTTAAGSSEEHANWGEIKSRYR